MKDSPKRQFAQQRDTVRTQCAALCWRDGAEGPEVLLITSRETGRWVLPKGWEMKGLTLSEAAAREAWEEAGVIGEVAPEELGLYTYDKVLDRGTKDVSAQPCAVTVFPLLVQKLASEFPEHRQRRRKWFAPDRASRKVEEPELKVLLEAFTPPGTAATAASDEGQKRSPGKGRKARARRKKG